VSLALRAVIHFLYLKHTPKQTLLSELEEVYGKDVISLLAVEKWTAALMADAASLLICPGPGGLVTLETSMLSAP
jgi:hypothetical protein